MVSKVLFSSNSDEWSTPLDVFNKLNNEFDFNLDVCATTANHKCENFFTQIDDGLSKNWGGV
jgi:site-specific DNA-methyltransferase (adenine-specific)